MLWRRVFRILISVRTPPFFSSVLFSADSVVGKSDANVALERALVTTDTLTDGSSQAWSAQLEARSLSSAKAGGDGSEPLLATQDGSQPLLDTAEDRAPQALAADNVSGSLQYTAGDS